MSVGLKVELKRFDGVTKICASQSGSLINKRYQVSDGNGHSTLIRSLFDVKSINSSAPWLAILFLKGF